VKESQNVQELKWKWFHMASVAGLILGGAVLLIYDFWKSLGEALLIAGILAIVVDPYLKRRIQKEAGLDIFHHLLGFALPLEIKERLKQIVIGTKLYRQDMTMVCTFSATSTGMKIEFETRFEVVNPTPEIVPFRQRLQFEKSEVPTLLSISLTGDPQYGKDAKLSPLRGEEAVLAYEGRAIKIKPKEANERAWFSSGYSCEYPMSGFHVQNFGYPTIGFTLKVRSKPKNLRVTATPADKQTESEWVYPGLFMTGDHIQIRWEMNP
jgi:hypothetical protein